MEKAQDTKPISNVAKAPATHQADPSKKLTLRRLERHLWAAADILRGKIDSSDYKHYILGLLFYKRLCDVWQEEYQDRLTQYGDRQRAADPAEHRFHIPEGAFWHDVRQHRAKIGKALNRAFKAIEQANQRLHGVFQDVDFDNQERFPDSTLIQLLDHFELIPLTRRHTEADMLGNAYEYLIAQFADDAGKKGGEFYTPKQVVRLIVECLEPEEGMSIYDPTCGSGGMLLEAVHHLKQHGKNPRKLKLYGQEMNLNTWAICQINLFLHDIVDAYVARGDTLRDPKHLDAEGQLMTFDRVLANPPFSLKKWGHETWEDGDRFARDVYGCPPKSFGDLAFVQHMIHSLKPEGRLGVVVPHGVLYRKRAEGKIRRALLEDDLIEAVIGLAPRLFYGTSIWACLLLIRRDKPAERRGKVLFIDGVDEAVEMKNKNALSPANVDRLVRAFHDFQDVDGFSAVVPLDKILAQGGDLNLSRYVRRPDPEEEIDVEAEFAKWIELREIRDGLEAEVERQLKQLGYGS